MITTPTVFILGAGASAPYGFPVGAKLVEKIKSFFHKDALNIRNELIYAGVADDEKIIDRFTENIRYLQDNSIDLFLSRHSEFVDIGKYLITKAIADYEDPTKLSEDWYKLLWNSLAGFGVSKENFLNNQVRFITFNYDRSLEYYLNFAFKNSFSLTSSIEAHEYSGKIKILHVHGKVGYLPWESKPTQNPIRDYVNKYSVADILNSMQSIKVISESLDYTQEFILARDYIEDAQRVVILGLGNNSENFRRLGLLKSINPETEFQVSAFGFNSRQVEDFHLKTFKSMKNVFVDREGNSCKEFLEKYVLL